MTFDDVLPALLRRCEADGGWPSVDRACVVRDVRGKVRLVIRPALAARPDDVVALRERLEGALSADLGRWFVTPILVTTDPGERGNVARTVLDHGEPWNEAAYPDPVTGHQRTPNRPDGWLRVERSLGKHGWIGRERSTSPWPLEAGAPAIVTFYSFKGGAGRTTALAACAWQLAAGTAGRDPKRVAIVDLDLEAPGVGALFAVDTERGVLDIVVDHVATSAIDLDRAYGSASSLGAEAPKVDVFPAGALNEDFVRKLGRLDYATAEPWGASDRIPVHQALVALLGRIRGELNPDYILLDARAGLHDLAGMSLHGLAHVDVIVTRASRQALDGFSLTVRTLARRKREEDLRCVTVHGFGPLDAEAPEGRAEIEEVRSHAYRVFSDAVYDDAPEETDDAAAHWPWMLPRDERLHRFATLASVREALFSEPYRRLTGRVVELCVRESGQEDEEATAGG
jgi:MinD-like ATPase involved in chromosome partitioning or flagellar assembly